MTTTFTKDEYLAGLKRVGWLAALPKKQARALRASITKAFTKKKKLTAAAPELFLPLAVTSFDAEMIEGSGPAEPCSYHSLVTQLAEASFGQLVLDRIVDTLDWKKKKARVSITVRGKRYSVNLQGGTDWVDGVIIDFLNDVLERTGKTHRFQVIPAIDQCIFLAFVPDDVWERACATGLVPSQEDVETD